MYALSQYKNCKLNMQPISTGEKKNTPVLKLVVEPLLENRLHG